MYAARRARARLRGGASGGVHDSARAQPRHRTVRASSQPGRDALGAYAWRRGALAVLRLAAQAFADRQAILRGAESLSRFLYLHQSRPGHVLAENQDQLPARGFALSPDDA